MDKANTFNNGSFGMIWTSFGLGVNEAFNPSLAAILAKQTSDVHVSLNHMSFSVLVTNERRDLELLSYLQQASVKEVYIETCNMEGVANKHRVKFTITGLSAYSHGMNVMDDREIPSFAQFSVTGILQPVLE